MTNKEKSIQNLNTKTPQVILSKNFTNQLVSTRIDTKLYKLKVALLKWIIGASILYTIFNFALKTGPF